MTEIRKDDIVKNIASNRKGVVMCIEGEYCDVALGNGYEALWPIHMVVVFGRVTKWKKR